MKLKPIIFFIELFLFVQPLKDAFILFWQNIFNFKGVTTRKDYWFGYLSNIILMILVGIFVGVVASIIGDSSIAPIFGIPFGLVALVYLLGYIVGSISIYFRRMRDIGKTVTFAVILMVCGAIPYIGIIPGFYSLYLVCQPSIRKQLSETIV